MNNRSYFKNNKLAAVLIAPQLFLIFIFFYWPASQAIYWAFTTQPPFGGGNEWVGFQNFQELFNDKVYWNSVYISIKFAIYSTCLSVVLSSVMALCVDRQLSGYQFYRFAFFLPYAIAAPAVGLAFRFIFAPDAGFISIINNTNLISFRGAFPLQISSQALYELHPTQTSASHTPCCIHPCPESHCVSQLKNQTFALKELQLQ
jgi:ABC-type sugar transport system permease subunit